MIEGSPSKVMMNNKSQESDAPIADINQLREQFMKNEYGLQIIDGNAILSHQSRVTGGVKYIKCHGKIFERLAEIRGAKREADIIKSFLDRALINLPIPGEELIHMSLFYSIVILYGKVFTSNSRCRPHPDIHSIFNEDEVATHQELMKIRNTVLAHAGDNAYEVNDMHLMVNEKGDVLGFFFNFVDIAFPSREILTTIRKMVEKICVFYDEKAKHCLESIYNKFTEATDLNFLGEEKDEYRFHEFHSNLFAYIVKFEASMYEFPPFKIFTKGRSSEEGLSHSQETEDAEFS